MNATKGNTRAQKLFTEMLKAAEQLQREQREEFVEIAIAYKLNAENVIRECEARGCGAARDLSSPEGHPD